MVINYNNKLHRPIANEALRFLGEYKKKPNYYQINYYFRLL